jgi:hypothetical protein
MRKQADMAGRILNRRELREQADHAAQSAEIEMVDDGDEAGEMDAEAPAKKKKARAKVPGPAKARKPRAKKAPPRMRARWGIFDAGMKQVAAFDYNQRAVAEAKLLDFQATKKGIHFLQIVKEQMPEPVLAEVAVVS